MLSLRRVLSRKCVSVLWRTRHPTAFVEMKRAGIFCSNNFSETCLSARQISEDDTTMRRQLELCTSDSVCYESHIVICSRLSVDCQLQKWPKTNLVSSRRQLLQTRKLQFTSTSLPLPILRNVLLFEIANNVALLADCTPSKRLFLNVEVEFVIKPSRQRGYKGNQSASITISCSSKSATS